MTPKAKILLVEDDTTKGWGGYLKDNIERDLSNIGFESKVYLFLDIQDAIQDIQTEEGWKILVTDAMGPHEEVDSVRELLRLANEMDIPSIVVSGTHDVELVSEFYYSYKIIRFFAKYPFKRNEFKKTIQNIYIEKYGDSEASRMLVELEALVSNLEIDDQIKSDVKNHLKEAIRTIEGAEAGKETKGEVVKNSLEKATNLLKSGRTTFDALNKFIEKAEKLGTVVGQATGWLGS